MKISNRYSSKLAALLVLCATSKTTLGVSDNDESTNDKTHGPTFFLIDNTDQLCLGSDTFKRCSLNTLYFAVGSPGTFYD